MIELIKTVTISSKRQITIPVDFKEYKSGEKVLIAKKNNELILKPIGKESIESIIKKELLTKDTYPQDSKGNETMMLNDSSSITNEIKISSKALNYLNQLKEEHQSLSEVILSLQKKHIFTAKEIAEKIYNSNSTKIKLTKGLQKKTETFRNDWEKELHDRS